MNDFGNPETRDKIDLVYTESKDMRADVYTKHFTDKDKWGHAIDLINVVDVDVKFGSRPRPAQNQRRAAAVSLAAPAVCCIGIQAGIGGAGAARVLHRRACVSTASCAGHPARPRAVRGAHREHPFLVRTQFLSAMARAIKSQWDEDEDQPPVSTAAGASSGAALPVSTAPGARTGAAQAAIYGPHLAQATALNPERYVRWEHAPPMMSLNASQVFDQGVFSRLQAARRMSSRPPAWRMTMPGIVGIEKCLYRTAMAFLDCKYMIIENLTFGTPLPQIVSLNAEAKVSIIVRESEKLGMNVNEQQLGEIMSICIFAPDTEDTWGPVTDNQCLQALHQRGWMRAGISQDHCRLMAEWLSSAEAAWLHLALFDLINDFYNDQASVAHCEWIQDSSGLIYSDPMKKKETIFRVMASDIFVTFPRLTSDVHGGCGVSW